MKLSIIVPIYNVEKYLDKCIKSLINQRINYDYEIILINDGSTDKSGEIVKKYLKNSKIVYIEKKNGGQSSARNEGLKIAKGQYIGFVDSDDYIELDMYEKMLKKAIEDKSEIVLCGISRVNIQGYELLNYIPQNTSFKDILNNAYAWNKIYKKELFVGVDFPEGKHYEDVFVVPKLYLKAQKVSLINEKLYYYLEREGATTLQRDNEKMTDMIEAYIELKKYILNNKELEEKIKTEFEICSYRMKNNFLLRTISNYSIKYFNKNQNKIVKKFKELDIWENSDYIKLYFSKYFPKNHIKKNINTLNSIIKNIKLSVLYKLSNINSLRKRFFFNIKKKIRALLNIHGIYASLKDKKNIHKGERCFIIGTGPSLNKNYLSLLKKEKTFGVNAVCKWFEELGIETTYFGIQDIRAFEALENEILSIKKSKLIISDSVFKMKKNKFQIDKKIDVFPLNYLNHNTYHKKFTSKFSYRPYEVTYDGYSITYSLIQIAMYMGFNEIYLIGMDCNYDLENEDQYSVSHNIIQENPKLAGYKMIQALKIIKKYAKMNNIKIYDCSLNGKLDLFEKIRVEDVLIK